MPRRELGRGSPALPERAFEVDQPARATNEEFERRGHAVRILPKAETGLRPIRAPALEMHENWLEAHRYLNTDDPARA